MEISNKDVFAAVVVMLAKVIEIEQLGKGRQKTSSYVPEALALIRKQSAEVLK